MGVESLIRWMHPQKGLVSPAYFIELAEDTGQIVQLGQWVLEEACSQLRQWENNTHYCNLYLSVNVSARQFHQPNFVDQIKSVIEKTGANPHRLKLELTETVVLDNIDEVIRKIKLLSEVGVEFALDDFGTGYSSLSYLKRLPLSEVKIDKSFVNDVITDVNDAAIVQAILAMSQTLGLQAVAEGVETREQYDYLVKHGCLKFQGYLFGKPMPIGQLEQFISAHSTTL